jgi:hypothetical protein
MLLKSNIGNMDFKKILKIKICVSTLIIFIGLKCILLVLLNQVGELQSLTAKFGVDLVNLSFMQGFYTGFGCALVASGIAMIIRNVVLLRNSEKFKRAEIEYLDERNRFIRSVTFNTTSYIFLVALAFAIVISGMFNLIVFVTFLGTFFVYLILLLATYLIFKAKY